MTPRALTAILVLASAASSQHLVYEPAEPILGLGDAASQVEVGDLDGDGFDDLVVAGTIPGTPLRVARGLGDGEFSLLTWLDADQAGPVVLVDVDGDDVLDLLHGTAQPQTVALSRGLGDGTFAAPITIVDAPTIPSTAIARISIGDFDDDGVVDLAFDQGYGFFSSIRVFRGAGDGTFTEIAELSSGLFIATAEVGDVDGDGFDDVVVSSGSGPQWYRSLGDGTFAAAQPAADGVLRDVFASPQVEFVFFESGDIVLRNLVGDAFEEVGRITPPFDTSSSVSSTGDVDGDGRTDLVATGISVGYVFLQTDDEDFEHAASFTLVIDDLALDAAVVVDGNGRRDLAVATLFSGVWLAADATYGLDEPFTDLGGNTPGSAGFPTQILAESDGTLTARVVSTAPSSPIFALWGASLGAPRGLSSTSPSPDRVLGPFITSPLGTLEACASDALPLGLDVFAQWWIVDEDGLASTSTVKIGD